LRVIAPLKASFGSGENDFGQFGLFPCSSRPSRWRGDVSGQC
jgi:hypothetical protein